MDTKPVQLPEEKANELRLAYTTSNGDNAAVSILFDNQKDVAVLVVRLLQIMLAIPGQVTPAGVVPTEQRATTNEEQEKPDAETAA